MVIWFIILSLGGYILGAIPLTYLLAKRRGVNLTQSGTRQVGAGNFWRMADSRKLAIPVGAFDFAKGAFLVWVASRLGFSVSQQVWAGIAVMAGHNWPVFLGFRGGRGVATAIGILVIMPFINNFTPWVVLSFAGVGLVSLAIARSTPLPVLVALVSVPVSSAILSNDVSVTVALAALVPIVVIKRLTAPPSGVQVAGRALLVNRLLFDRDIRDRKEWMNRKGASPNGEGPQS